MLRFEAVRSASVRSVSVRIASLIRVVLFGAALAALAPAAFAQGADNYPSHPIKFIIPYGPGGATDIVARHLAARLGDVIGQPIIVENRPGASGNIALETVAKAAPDGYTLLVGNVSTNAINESTFAHLLKIKPSRDLVGITRLVEIPHVVAASTAFPPNNVSELIEYARQHPGKINYASAGLGSYPQLDMMRLAAATKTSMTHVPYKNGASGMVTALLTNECQVAFINLSSMLPQIKAGRVKVLADVAPERVPELPSIPTMAEQGYPGIGTNAWQALFAPAGTPKPVIDKIFKAVTEVMSRPDVREAMERAMMTISLSKSPEEFNDFVQAETRKWADFIRANNVRID